MGDKDVMAKELNYTLCRLESFPTPPIGSGMITCTSKWDRTPLAAHQDVDVLQEGKVCTCNVVL